MRLHHSFITSKDTRPPNVLLRFIRFPRQEKREYVGEIPRTCAAKHRESGGFSETESFYFPHIGGSGEEGWDLSRMITHTHYASMYGIFTYILPLKINQT